jgi:hypothetical protein
MNERIRELEKQATETVKCGLNGTSTAEVFNRKKFAELIVKETLRITGAPPSMVETVKKHFGVE